MYRIFGKGHYICILIIALNFLACNLYPVISSFILVSFLFTFVG